ncbi:MAG: site-specific integrase [Oscillibacter sp.]|nr:site-specific integrase [Oscillibacter sp.]
MPMKINRSVIINGVRKWIHANSEQEYAEKLMKLSGSGMEKIQASNRHIFGEYAENWFQVYSLPNIETATAATYRRQLKLYLIPAFGEKAVEDITTDDIQSLFNSMTGTKSTKEKAKMVLNMILEAAVEDGLLPRNPLKSRRLKITGEASKVTEEYTVEQMRFLIRNLDKVEKSTDRAYLAIQALHPLRLEEVLGLKWADIDFESMTLSVRRAVTHPTRNQPEVKRTKTEASVRVIGLSAIAARFLNPGGADEFVFGGQTPYTYQKVRRMCERIKRDTGFEDNITPIRFRTTVLTDIYDQTKDVKTAQAAAGHASPTMTMRRYAKGRDGVRRSGEIIDHIYGSD